MFTRLLCCLDSDFLMVLSMKYFLCCATGVFLSSLAILPATAVAQTASMPSDTTTSSGSGLYQEGPGDSGIVRYQRMRGYYWEQSGDLQKKISALGNAATTSVFMPVLFGVGIKNISPNFGDPRSGGRTHKGEDIMAVKGTPIVSPTPAVVLHTGVGNSDSSGTPTDPFPRLTGEFSLQEKISYLSTIFTQTSSSTALAQFLVLNFRGTFIAALAANIPLPLPITDVLASMPAPSLLPSRNVGGALPPGDLDIGSSGTAVATLQKYLIPHTGRCRRCSQASCWRGCYRQFRAHHQSRTCGIPGGGRHFSGKRILRAYHACVCRSSSDWHS